jgi:thymidine kinase
MKSILTILFMLVPALAPAADTGKDMGAACAERAKAWFKEVHGDGRKTLKDGRAVKVGYEAHYNGKRKQCLVRETSDTPAQGKRPAVSNVTVREIDTKDRYSVASLVRVGGKMKYCVVERKKCQSEQDWEKLAAPLMKE